MKKVITHSSTLFLRFVIFLIAFAVLALCIFGIPSAIGTFSFGGYDPLLVAMYIPALPFFIGLHQTLTLLGYIDKNKAFSELSVASLKNIKFCATAIAIFYAALLPYVYYLAELDDAPGVIVIGMVLCFAPTVVAVFAAVLQKILQNAIDIQKENDLTV